MGLRIRFGRLTEGHIVQFPFSKYLLIFKKKGWSDNWWKVMKGTEQSVKLREWFNKMYTEDVKTSPSYEFSILTFFHKFIPNIIINFDISIRLRT